LSGGQGIQDIPGRPRGRPARGHFGTGLRDRAGAGHGEPLSPPRTWARRLRAALNGDIHESSGPRRRVGADDVGPAARRLGRRPAAICRRRRRAVHPGGRLLAVNTSASSRMPAY